MALCSRLLLCLLLATLLCTLQVQGFQNTVLDCCHTTSDTPFSVKQIHRLRTYRIQGAQMGCPIHAIVLITKKGRELCFPPDAPWAQDLIRRLDRRERRQQRTRSSA